MKPRLAWRRSDSRRLLRTSSALPMLAQGLVHVGDERAGLHAGAVRHLDDAVGKLAGASFKSAMKAPLPVFTSITSPSSPAASFLERIEAVISGMDSTVAVTSRIA